MVASVLLRKKDEMSTLKDRNLNAAPHFPWNRQKAKIPKPRNSQTFSNCGYSKFRIQKLLNSKIIQKVRTYLLWNGRNLICSVITPNLQNLFPKSNTAMITQTLNMSFARNISKASEGHSQPITCRLRILTKNYTYLLMAINWKQLTAKILISPNYRKFKTKQINYQKSEISIKLI